MITVPAAILQATCGQMLECGRGRHECVAFWVGPDLEVEDAIHPVHLSSPGSYEVNAMWLNEFWLELGRRRRGILAQVHTHPGRAFHSETDDTGAVAVHRGFLSIVIPHFAINTSLAGARAYEMTDVGWQSLEIDNAVRVL